jgi:signal transduction histidine kinase
LLGSDALHNAIPTGTNLAVIATDANGIIQLFNGGAERMLGYNAVEVADRIAVVDLHDRQELIARARALSLEFSTTIAPDLRAITCKASRRGEDSYESAFVGKHGERVPVAVSITVVRDGLGGIAGYTLTATGIPVHRPVRVDPFDLLTRLSHEMRTPLSAILGFAQLLDSAKPPPTILQKRRIDRILEAGWHLDKLIDMTRDLALIESGALSLSLESVPLAGAMRDCQAMIESQAQFRSVRVIVPSLENQWSVLADRVRLQEVLGCLLSDAIEHGKADGAVVLHCETHGSEWIRIGINKRGKRSSAERLAMHFPPFAGLEQNVTALDGAGPGLLLAGRLVDLMGGAIRGAIDGDRKTFSCDLRRTRAPIASPAGARPQGVVHSIDDDARKL